MLHLLRKLLCRLFHSRRWVIVSQRPSEHGHSHRVVYECQRCGDRWVDERHVY